LYISKETFVLFVQWKNKNLWEEEEEKKEDFCVWFVSRLRWGGPTDRKKILRDDATTFNVHTHTRCCGMQRSDGHHRLKDHPSISNSDFINE
jgi:hypothetical protein